MGKCEFHLCGMTEDIYPGQSYVARSSLSGKRLFLETFKSPTGNLKFRVYFHDGSVEDADCSNAYYVSCYADDLEDWGYALLEFARRVKGENNA